MVDMQPNENEKCSPYYVGLAERERISLVQCAVQKDNRVKLCTAKSKIVNNATISNNAFVSCANRPKPKVQKKT